MHRAGLLLTLLVLNFSCGRSGVQEKQDSALPYPQIPEALVSKIPVPPVITDLISHPPKIIPVGNPEVVGDLSDCEVPIFIRYGTDQGLPLNSVFCSAPDENGNIWFGTAGGGVSRFDGERFTNYTVAHGLAGNVVFSMVRDNDGNIWIATSAGVSKYDGYRFVNYTVTDGLAANFMTCLLEDGSNHLWFGTRDGGVSRYDGQTFCNYAAKDGLGDNYVQCLLSDKDGGIWFGTAHAGAILYRDGIFRRFTKSDGLPDNSVNCIFQDTRGNLWFGTDDGISRYDGQYFRNFKDEKGMPENAITAIGEDEGGDLWFGTRSKAICRYDGKTFRAFGARQGFIGQKITSISKDKNGTLWFTSLDGGIIRYDDNKVYKYPVHGVFSILKDHAGAMWIGTKDEGVFRYNGNIIERYGAEQGLPDDWIWSILEDRAGNIWLGTDKSGACKFDGDSFTQYTIHQGLAGNTVTSIFQDDVDNLWFATLGGVSKFDGKSFTRYTTSQGLSGNNIMDVAEDAAGRMWFATHDDGLCVFDGIRCTHISTTQGLTSNTIYGTLKDDSGNMWFATNRGASIFDGQSFFDYTTKEGLPDDCIWAMRQDISRAVIWLGTNQGLVAIHGVHGLAGKREEPVIEIFNHNHGFPVREVNGGALFVEEEGAVWVGNGLGELEKLDYPAVRKTKQDTLIPNIRAIRVNNENLCWNDLLRTRGGGLAPDSLAILNEMMTIFGKVLSAETRDSLCTRYKNLQIDAVRRFDPVPVNLVLPYEDNSVAIDFQAAGYAHGVKIRYQYRLTGYSKDWSVPGSNTTAQFENIPPGEHTFRLRALGPSGISGETSFAFRVLRPWWTSWWAYVAYLAFGAGLFYLLYRLYALSTERKQVKEINIVLAAQEEERRRIARDLHDDIGVKLSAVKLYLSSLSGKASVLHDREIKSLAEQTESLVGETMQDVRGLLADLSPGMLEDPGCLAAVEDLVSKINASGRLQISLFVFGIQARFEKENELALYRMIQELINNILKHSHAARASLQIGLRDGKIVLMAEDNGCGFEKNGPHNGHGLRNLVIRTRAMKGTIAIDSEPGKGTSVTIEIPYPQQSK